MTNYKKLLQWGAVSGLLSMMAAAPAWAQDADQLGLVPPRPEEQPDPEFNQGDREALVRVRYTVTTDGTTADVRAAGGFSNSLYDDAAVRTVENWTFTPGTENGEAVAFYNQEYLLEFSSGESAVSSQVRETYEGITELMNNDEHQAAAEEVQRLLSGNISTVFDYAFLNDVLASAYMNLDQRYAALEASRKATMRAGPVTGEGERRDLLPPEILQGALRKRFLLAASLSQNVDARNTYQRLTGQFDIPEDDSIHEQYQALQERLDSTEPLGLLARLNGESWSYAPVRRSFAVTEVQDGSLERINVRCQRRNTELDFQTGVQWSLPETFGRCRLDFVGEPGTQFTFYEFPPDSQ